MFAKAPCVVMQDNKLTTRQLSFAQTWPKTWRIWESTHRKLNQGKNTGILHQTSMSEVGAQQSKSWLAGWLVGCVFRAHDIHLDNLAQLCHFSDDMIFTCLPPYISLSSIDILNSNGPTFLWQELLECSRFYASPAQKVWDWASSAALWRVRGARV